MSPANTRPTHHYILWLALLIGVVGIVYAFYVVMGTSKQPFTIPEMPASTPRTNVLLPQNAPAPTSADLVSAQKGFQYLVSYNGKAFSPATLSVKKGQTVRFTSSAPSPLTISLTGIQSPAIVRGAYWEHTFSAAGTMHYQSDSGITGTITVQ